MGKYLLSNDVIMRQQYAKPLFKAKIYHYVLYGNKRGFSYSMTGSPARLFILPDSGMGVSFRSND
ncbi:MAG: hypothetical protein RBS07_17465 [Lentimicrobium sp.]|nr:hypothetical protein [Lentimicrobium sp.]